MANSTKLAQIIPAISEPINQLFDPDKLNQIYKKTGFVKRKECYSESSRLFTVNDPGTVQRNPTLLSRTL